MSGDRILLAHGGGGELTRRLIDDLIVARLGNPALATLTDAAVLARPAGRLCLTTDASVVQPLFFPGGDIGRLAVAGTINDLAVMGADPLALCQSLIIEEGLPIAVLERVLDSVAATAAEAGVAVVAGDTKVVERRGGDGLIVSTAGIGVLPDGVDLGLHRCAAGDAVLVSGPIAEHGLTIMCAREGLGLTSTLASDVAPLHELAANLRGLGPSLRFLRDPTRGGLAGVLADLATTGHGVEVEEAAIPVSPAARHAAELLGLDLLGVANEGKLVAVVAAEAAAEALIRCHAHPRGRQAALIGRLVPADRPLVELITLAGGRRLVQRPYGEDLPRIC
jgi:hydrogenase expression/formation protein HypE